MSSTITTFVGAEIDVLDPHYEKIHLVDIAHGLAHINRYNGHAFLPYTVAQHSVLASRNVPDRHALQALMHDASEAYIGDVSSPLKNSDLMAGYRQLEGRYMWIISRRFGFSWPLSLPTHQVDEALFHTETRDLRYYASYNPDKCLSEPIVEVWSPARAYDEFVCRYREVAA